MSGGEVVCSGWLRKSPPEKKLKRYVSRASTAVLRALLLPAGSPAARGLMLLGSPYPFPSAPSPAGPGPSLRAHPGRPVAGWPPSSGFLTAGFAGLSGP